MRWRRLLNRRFNLSFGETKVGDEGFGETRVTGNEGLRRLIFILILFLFLLSFCFSFSFHFVSLSDQAVLLYLYSKIVVL
jgi:hypothetical protein